VEEGVAPRDRAVRPLFRDARPEELLAPRQSRAARLDLRATQLEAGGGRGRREFSPGHARHFQDALVGRGETIELALDHRVDVRRNADGQVSAGRTPNLRALDEHARANSRRRCSP
jgi:hypothetical protein